MPLETMIALFGLAIASAFTPGPNNALVANSGATFGLKRTIPHILGIAIGFSLMIFVVGFSLGTFFEKSAVLRETLRWAGAALLLYIAWKIATSGGLGSDPENPRPFRFIEAAGFQWINPKAWAMAIAIPAQFVTGDEKLVSAIIVAAVFVLVGIASAASWAIAGQSLTRWINTADRLRWFNMAMGGMIAGFVVFLVID